MRLAPAVPRPGPSEYSRRAAGAAGRPTVVALGKEPARGGIWYELGGAAARWWPATRGKAPTAGRGIGAHTSVIVHRRGVGTRLKDRCLGVMTVWQGSVFSGEGIPRGDAPRNEIGKQRTAAMFYLHVVYMGKGEDGRSAHVGGALPYRFKLHALYMREAEEASRHARGTQRTISERGYFACAIAKCCTCGETGETRRT